MLKSFKPKYESKYNCIVATKVPLRKEEISFEPKRVECEMWRNTQVSYRTRVEKHNFREYNG